MANDKKICFIMCTNNEKYMNEAAFYISNLIVPQGYEIDFLTVDGAKSMAAGYNEAAAATDAKYKVYLHQDVFIVNKNFIQDILDIFKDEKIGMIGMVGSPKLPKTYVPWYGYRVGALYSSNITQSGCSVLDNSYTGVQEVEAVDGFMMITQVDIPWREDLFTGWDFYDVSQSAEYQKAGYKVVVPSQSTPWCLHDDGFLNLLHYHEARRIFIKEYKDTTKEVW